MHIKSLENQFTVTKSEHYSLDSYRVLGSQKIESHLFTSVLVSIIWFNKLSKQLFKMQYS